MINEDELIGQLASDEYNLRIAMQNAAAGNSTTMPVDNAARDKSIAFAKARRAHFKAALALENAIQGKK